MNYLRDQLKFLCRII